MNTQKYQVKLEEERDKLLQELGGFAVRDEDNPDNWNSTGEEINDIPTSEAAAEKLEDLTERKATEGPLENRLKQVNLALHKISENKYGLCEIGGEEIEEDRLEANPAARTCKEHMNEEGTLQ